MKAFRYHDDAREELIAAVDWYDQQRAGLGGQFNAAIEQALESIRLSPAAFALHDGVSIRRYVLRRFPYLILYQEFDEAIWVLAIAHQRRDPDYWKYRQINDQ